MMLWAEPNRGEMRKVLGVSPRESLEDATEERHQDTRSGMPSRNEWIGDENREKGMHMKNMDSRAPGD